MTTTLFERYVFVTLFGAAVLALSVSSLGLYGLGLWNAKHHLALWAVGIAAWFYACYHHIWSGIVIPTESQLSKDIQRLGSVVPLDRYTASDFYRDDVERYYASTSFRDYRIFELGTGCNALHTELVPEVRLPYQAGFLQQLVHVVAHMPSQAVTGTVLEVGFGKGSNLIYLASLFPSAQLVGVDLTEEHVRYAKSYAEGSRLSNVSFFKGDASDLGGVAPKGQRYDLIFGVESFCHLDADDALQGFLSFASQHVKPGGRIVVVDGFRSRSFAAASPEVQQAMNLAESGFRIRRMASKDKWQELASAVGFDTVHDVDLTRQAAGFWTVGWKVAQLLLLVPPPSPALLLFTESSDGGIRREFRRCRDDSLRNVPGFG